MMIALTIVLVLLVLVLTLLLIELNRYKKSYAVFKEAYRNYTEDLKASVEYYRTRYYELIDKLYGETEQETERFVAPSTMIEEKEG